jgi:hypothetical protein
MVCLESLPGPTRQDERRLHAIVAWTSSLRVRRRCCRTARMNLQVIVSPDGEILWVSGPLPSPVHDPTAARLWGIVRELAASGLVTLADKGYMGARAIDVH